MKLNRRRSVTTLAVLAAAVLGVSVPPVAGQVAVGQDGGAFDANPRVGSGGSYTAGLPRSSFGAYGSLGNNIVTGNVTGGRQFRGGIGYTDPLAFRGSLGSTSFDDFTRSATGVTSGGQLIDFAQQNTAFFGNSIVAPPGTVRVPGTGGYVPPRISGFGATADFAVFNELRRTDPGTTAAIESRFGNVLEADDPTADVTPTIAEDFIAGESLLRATRTDGLGDRRSLADMASRNLSPFTTLGRDERLSDLEGERLRSLRDELLRDEAGQRVNPDELQADGRVDGRVDAGRIQDGQVESDAAGRIDEGLTDGAQRYRLASPAEQSAQYRQLAARLDRFRQDPLADRLRPGGLREPTVEPGADDLLPGLPEAAPGGRAVPALPREPQAQAGPVDPPVILRSFSEGVASPTLKTQLAEAEALLEDGRYVTALARFEAAGQLVRNQPLVTMGTAVAELGAGFYRRSAQTLRSAYTRSPELTMGRVDVDGLLGGDRADQLDADLRRIAGRDRQAEDPVFLLAFLAYGRGEYRQAATFLDLAEERSGDPFYNTLKRLWSLDARAEPAEPATRPATRPAAD
jgi:tetratricopeptide (TPR) repeat protein